MSNWQVEVKHEGLNKHRVIRGWSKYIVKKKAVALQKQWNEAWRKIAELKNRLYDKESKKKAALEMTKEAEAVLGELENILMSSLERSTVIDWESIQDKGNYPINKPKPTIPPREPEHPTVITPLWVCFCDSILPFQKKQKKAEKEAEFVYQELMGKWRKIRDKNIEKYEKSYNEWKANECVYLKERVANNERLLYLKKRYDTGEADALVEYCDLVLSLSSYIDTFPQEFDLQYISVTKVLIVDYRLPSKDDFPNLKEVKYNVSRDEFIEKFLTEPAFNKLYDNVLYQTVLRNIHELYEADIVNAIDAIVFNGIVSFVDKAVGEKTTACILSVMAKKEKFLQLKSANVDPKECFRQLKGVGSSKLHGMAAVVPIVTMNKEDKRFVEAYEVVNSLDETTNLAAMDWQDFENLIRELFEEVFGTTGGEVKITRASRDEGVDAIAFDPDPIRGGKIVIQAKRYVNPVGVSAVRDLYGTVMNEGAIKGILVTTSDYGPDAYKFAKDKPLTLLNGGNLLHMLAEHGHKAKIDIAEARKIYSENQKKD